MKRIASALGAFILIAALMPLSAYADGVQSRGRISNGVVVADGPAFKTGLWLGAKVDTQSTDIAGINLSNDISYGIAGGYDYVLSGSSILVGVMGDISMPQGNFALLGGGDLNYTWFVGGRAGALVSERFLAYGLIGWTSLDGSLPTTINNTGFTYGAGAELMLTANISTGVEWRRVDIGADGPITFTQDTFGAFLRYRF